MAATVALATRLSLPVVATHPVQFLEADDFKAHEARVCIAQGYVLGDQRRPRTFTPEQYFKTQDEMARLFADVPQTFDAYGGHTSGLGKQQGIVSVLRDDVALDHIAVVVAGTNFP